MKAEAQGSFAVTSNIAVEWIISLIRHCDSSTYHAADLPSIIGSHYLLNILYSLPVLLTTNNPNRIMSKVIQLHRRKFIAGGVLIGMSVS